MEESSISSDSRLNDRGTWTSEHQQHHQHHHTVRGYVPEYADFEDDGGDIGGSGDIQGPRDVSIAKQSGANGGNDAPEDPDKERSKLNEIVRSGVTSVEDLDEMDIGIGMEEVAIGPSGESARGSQDALQRKSPHSPMDKVDLDEPTPRLASHPFAGEVNDAYDATNVDLSQNESETIDPGSASSAQQNESISPRSDPRHSLGSQSTTSSDNNNTFPPSATAPPPARPHSALSSHRSTSRPIISPQPLSPSRYRPYGSRQTSGTTIGSGGGGGDVSFSGSGSSTPDSRQVSPSPIVHDLPLSIPPIHEPQGVNLGSHSTDPEVHTNRASSIPAPTSESRSPKSPSHIPPPRVPITPNLKTDGSSPIGAFRSISPSASSSFSPRHTQHPFTSDSQPTQGLGLSVFSPGDMAPRSISFKPALPTASLALNGQAHGVDGSAPFESIELDTGSPVVQEASLHLPSGTVEPIDSTHIGHLTVDHTSTSSHVDASGKNMKRRSWGGFGFKKSNQKELSPQPPSNEFTERRHSTSEKRRPEERPSSNTPAESETKPVGAANAEAGPSTPPRRHAPPAHPHPYPIPSSPTSYSPSRRPNSMQSNRSSTLEANTSAPPAAKANVNIEGTLSHPSTQGLGVKGVSAFEKVVSHTRPSWLPPKPKEEDEAHLHQWADMMSQSREAEAARRKIQEARRVEKEKRLAASTSAWETLVGLGPGGSTMSSMTDHLHPHPAGSSATTGTGMNRSASSSSAKGKSSAAAAGSGRATPESGHSGFSVERVKTDPTLRKLWFEGVPSHLRGRAWSLAIGNPLAISRDAYKTYQKRAQRAMDSGRFPKDILDRIDQDMDKTLPHLRLFVEGSPMRMDLRDFVCAWVVYRSDSGNGYAPYITHLSAMFLLTSPPSLAFHSLVNLLSRPFLHAFYTETKDEIEAFYRVFENLQADRFPQIFANCKNLGLKLPESYFRTLFLEQLPFEACCRLWDQIVLEGDSYILRAALSIFSFLEPRLYYPDKEEIESVLNGRNGATELILARERERARLRGEAWDDTVDGTLSVFGINEDYLFDWLESEEWKESRFERLVKREMPD
ncbi:rab-GTPase-TBC domain-domain-containing protein [Kockovaella imperatae]|uniref:Rab-GTPase-TBC domain-domain-containing protein n=1 Tax=Kockovaella imperatae TaxID=4999 RepID=A0A1Y1UHY8_9TREE|nr:rab-GTPase-TBC domain-domain-containing protein [Kockovaella imperatae]ORX37609.1 rab-GTPase-TBC domain-domain-containing protein [Kockovaella imperatae]